jgi:DNA polymerase-3 subunit epsilon
MTFDENIQRKDQAIFGPPFLLDRPLVAIDLETHAFVGPADARIVELAILRIEPSGRVSKEKGQLIRPPTPITDEAESHHGISNEMVRSAPPFKSIAVSLFPQLQDVDFVGFNLKAFDLPVLREEFLRCNMDFAWDKALLLDGLVLWRKLEPRTLTDAVRKFLHQQPTDAHRALGDAKDAAAVAFAMVMTAGLNSIKEVDDLCFPKNPEALDPDGKIVWNSVGDAILNFSNHRGKPLHLVEPSFLRWILRSDFTREVKDAVSATLGGQVLRKPRP